MFKSNSRSEVELQIAKGDVRYVIASLVMSHKICDDASRCERQENEEVESVDLRDVATHVAYR
jgi:hypothetical protein